MAVLGKDEEIVSLMVAHVQPHDQTINNLRDQFGRTALHYAYASTDSAHLIQILLSAGCSEAVFDMVDSSISVSYLIALCTIACGYHF